MAMDDYKFRETFSKNLIKYMHIHKLTQKDVAKITGVSHQSVSNWVNCKQVPRMGIIETLADRFGILKSDLLESSKAIAKPTVGMRIPILGVVPCGVPVEAIEDVIDYEEVSEALYKTCKLFGLKAKGDSMSPKIEHGDTLIVRQQNSIESGQIGIVKVNGDEATCKKIKLHNHSIALVPINDLFNTVEYNAEQVEKLPVQIVGRVVEIRRSI